MRNFVQHLAFWPQIDLFFIRAGRVFADFWPVLDFLAQDFLDRTLLDEEIFCQHWAFWHDFGTDLTSYVDCLSQ